MIFRTCLILLIASSIATPFIATAQSYFQQEVNYKIDVRLDDEKHELYAFEQIEYINNSPNTLTFIYIHLWPNAYKDNSTALAKNLLRAGETKLYFAKEQDRGYIDSLSFKVKNQTAQWELLKDSIDICKLHLNEPLKSGDTILISTPFHVKLPSAEISRLGHIGQSYQITQWYPKPAVYDKNGWNQMPYLNQGEFYSEYGSFDVSITLPKNYVVGATGDLVNGEEELKWLEEKAKKTAAIAFYNPIDMSFPPSDTQFKTLRYKQENVHDFAWFCDKRYHVLRGEVITPNTQRKVTTWVMFTNAQADLWKKSIEYVNDAIYYYSLWNGDYPYNNCTAVDGTISAGGGMEYPNITVIGNVESALQLDLTIAHEVGHNWFYGIIGSNERIHPWMDEGINSFYECRYIEKMYPNNRLLGKYADMRFTHWFDLNNYKHRMQYELWYMYNAAKHKDQPIELPANFYTGNNYGGIVYSKTALAFNYLRAYVGEEKMDAAMQRYFEEWKFKHPSPTDFRKIMEETTGKDLTWFFDDVINTTKKTDYKISFAYQLENGVWRVGIKNKGDIASPVIINGFKDTTLAATIIYQGFKGSAVFDFPPDSITHFKIDYNGDMTEVNRNNNTYRTKGIFKKTEPLKLQFLTSLDNPDKTQFFYTPVAGWNNYNKWMLGMLFHNVSLTQKKFEYQLMPMYSFGTKGLTGYSKAAYYFFPKNNLIQQLSIGAVTTRYAYADVPMDLYFNKIAPELNIEFKNKSAISPYKHTLRYRNINIIQDAFDVTFQLDATGGSYQYSKKSATLHFNDLNYTFSKKDAIKPYSLNLNLQQGQNIFKTALTANYSHNYRRKSKGLDLRLFAGTFLFTNAVDAGPYRFRLSGQRGYQDYLNDHIYLGRTETSGIWANQFTETDGGFKFYSPLGQTSQWVTALNIKSSLGNLKLPINVFADIGITGKDGRTNETILYDAGICIPVIKNMFEVYFPLLICQGFKDYKTANNLKYSETIRFTLNLNMANPFDLLKEIEL